MTKYFTGPLHMDGQCRPGWRTTDCEECEHTINTHEELLRNLREARAALLALSDVVEGTPLMREIEHAIARAEEK